VLNHVGLKSERVDKEKCDEGGRRKGGEAWRSPIALRWELGCGCQVVALLLQFLLFQAVCTPRS